MAATNVIFIINLLIILLIKNVRKWLKKAHHGCIETNIVKKDTFCIKFIGQFSIDQLIDHLSNLCSSWLIS